MRLLSAVVLMALSASCHAAEIGDELLENGGFEEADGDRPAAWSWDPTMEWAEANGNRWASAEATEPASRSISQDMPLEEDYWKIGVSCQVRVTDVVRGEEGWHNARIAMQFQDANGDMVGQWPDVMWFEGTMDDWETREREYKIPDGAERLNLSCSLFHTTGKVEWDDISVTLVALDPVLEDATLPDGVTARWDLENATRERAATRERVCINGLWRFHPVGLRQTELPAEGTGWGYLKVPGTWAPGVSRQTPIGPDVWEETLDLNATDAAWYAREISIPSDWGGRRVLINLDNPKHSARVMIDGEEAGTIDWPGGKVDVTEFVRPGETHGLSIHTVALPLEQEQILVAGPDIIEEARANVRFKGLCGDCWLESEPVEGRITDVFVRPSVREGELGLECELTGLDETDDYRLAAIVTDGDDVALDFGSGWFAGRSPNIEGRDRWVESFAGDWDEPKLWDIDQPNLYAVRVALFDEDGRLIDQTTPIQFGFREFWIDGKDFVLNGTPVHLRCLHYRNAGVDFGLASKAMARHTFRQARKMGFNFVIQGHYDFEAQSFAYLDDTLRAGDEAGFPMSHSIRHVKRIWREFEDAEKREAWDRVVDYEVRRVRNHPSILMYAMNHNFAGWRDDQNPGQLDGAFQPGEGDGGDLHLRRKAATLAEDYVAGLDDTRPCYHHQSGSLNQMITLNCYLCWTPLQERMEWVSRWRTDGVKPLFFVEFGLPHQASWGGHREGPFIWTNNVDSEPLTAEYGAIHNGDAAYELTPDDVRHYDTVERVYARGEPFHISSVLASYWSNRWEHNFLEIKSAFTRETWPAFRTYGVSAMLPWDQADLFRTVPGSSGEDVRLETNWDDLQRPGIAPDVVAWNTDWLTCPEPEGHVERTSLGETFADVNSEMLAFISGKPQRFTAQDHVFMSGEEITMQVVVLNDSRREVHVGTDAIVRVGGGDIYAVNSSGGIPPGGKLVKPIRFSVPEVVDDTEGSVRLTVTDSKNVDAVMQDEFRFTLVPKPGRPKVDLGARVACYDPKGLTRKLLKQHRVAFKPLTQFDPPEGCKLLIIGREAIGVDGPEIDIEALAAQGTTVLIFEQTEETLQRNWGFRTASPGTRRVYIRQPNHPMARGLTDELMRDWRGSGTLVEAYPKRTGFIGDYPREDWCGFANSRTWQWGNYGTVASVVVEKPHRGNYSFVMDCEFDLQYTPLFEWIAGAGRAIFCQLDLTGRDGDDPAAERVLANLLEYASVPRTTALGEATYVGGQATRDELEALGVRLGEGSVAILGSGADAVPNAGTVVCLGMSGDELSRVLPFEVKTEPRTVTHTLIGKPQSGALVGLGNSELHWRGRMPVEAIVSAPDGLDVVDTGVFAEGEIDGTRYVLAQFLPSDFDDTGKPYLRISRRRANLALGGILTTCGVAIDSRIGARLNTTPAADLDLAGTWRCVEDPDEALTVESMSRADFDASAWREITVPGMWEDQIPGLAEYNGVVWYRRVFDAPEVDSPVVLSFGSVDDEDWTYVNGKLIGHIGEDTNPDDYWEAAREYAVAAGELRPTGNVLVVKVLDTFQSGGIARGRIGIFHPGRWLDGHYVDEPTKLDDPYRYYRW